MAQSPPPNVTYLLGDKDLLNLYLHGHPKRVQVLPCSYNYRIDMYEHDTMACQREPWIVHGSHFIFTIPTNNWYQAYFSKVLAASLRVTQGTVSIDGAGVKATSFNVSYKGCSLGNSTLDHSTMPPPHGQKDVPKPQHAILLSACK